MTSLQFNLTILRSCDKKAAGRFLLYLAAANYPQFRNVIELIDDVMPGIVAIA